METLTKQQKQAVEKQEKVQQHDMKSKGKDVSGSQVCVFHSPGSFYSHLCRGWHVKGTYMPMCIVVYARMDIYICTYKLMNMCVFIHATYMCMHTFRYTHTHMHTHMHARACTHTTLLLYYISTCMHAHTHTCVLNFIVASHKHITSHLIPTHTHRGTHVWCMCDVLTRWSMDVCVSVW